MAGAGLDDGQPVPAASGWPAPGTVTAYAAAVLAFGYALVSLYWAVGGHALVSTIGGYVEHLARRGATLPVLIALAAALANADAAVLRPWHCGAVDIAEEGEDGLDHAAGLGHGREVACVG